MQRTREEASAFVLFLHSLTQLANRLCMQTRTRTHTSPLSFIILQPLFIQAQVVRLFLLCKSQHYAHTAQRP